METLLLSRYLRIAFILQLANFGENSGVNQYLPKPVIGAYFDENESMQKAFSLAINTINKCAYSYEICEEMHETPNDVRKHLFHQVHFAAMVVKADNEDVIDLYKKFGILAGVSNDPENMWTARNEYGLAGVIGPHERLSSVYVHELCELHDIPNIIVRRESKYERHIAQITTRYPNNLTGDFELVEHTSVHHFIQMINLYPDTKTLGAVFLAMMKKMKWTDFCILYEDSSHMDYFKLLDIYPLNSWLGSSFLKLGRGPNYSESLLMAKASKKKYFFVDCSRNILQDVLRQAQEIEIMTTGYHYIIADLDFHNIDVNPFRNSGVKISGVRLVDTTDSFVSRFVTDHLDDFGITSVEELRVKDALIFDAVAMFAQAYKDLNYHNQMFKGARLPKDYDIPTPWKDGISLRNYLLYTEMHGLSGPVMIDGDGQRRRFKLDILTLRQTGLVKIGEWDPDNGLEKPILNSSELPHYKVLITMNAPYAMLRNISWHAEGNDRYEGFVVDIIEALSREMKFTYTFYIQDDAKNGDCVKDLKRKVCECDGMMEKMLNNIMDLAITDLTITENRTKCVRFSTSFMNLGISILFKKSQKAEATWYSFFKPFDYDVWMYLALSYIAISILFFVVGRLSPSEWTNPFPCVEEPNELLNQFRIGNAFWFTMGSIMQQGSEIAPTGISTRILAGWWWFFCLIMVSSYTANLAAFLIYEEPVKLLNGIQDLQNQTTIKFGAKEGGSTYNYFQSSSNPYYRKLFEQMNNPEWKRRYMVDKNEKGIELAERDDFHYAFLMESSSIEYVVKRHCKLEEVGDYIDHKTYAIAVSNNFSIEEYNRLRETISILSERSVLKDLKSKWWDDKGAICGQIESNSPESMTGEQLKGIFIVLGLGIAFSCVLTVYEFVKKIQSTYTEMNELQIGFLKTATMELKSVMESNSIKPVLRKQRSAETQLSYSDTGSATTMTSV